MAISIIFMQSRNPQFNFVGKITIDNKTPLRGFLRAGRGESFWGENWTFFFIPGALRRGAGEVGANGAGADGAGANGAGDDGGLSRWGGCWGVTGWSESTGLSQSTETESDLEPISTRKYFGYLERTRYGPLYNGDNGGLDASSLIKTWEQETKLEGIWSGLRLELQSGEAGLMHCSSG